MDKTAVATGKLTKCPACHHSFQLPENIRLAEVTKCPKCKALLEVTNRIPLTLGKLK